MIMASGCYFSLLSCRLSSGQTWSCWSFHFLSLASGPLHMQLPQDEMLPNSFGLSSVNSFFRPQLSHSLLQEAFYDTLLFFGWIFSGSRTTLVSPLPLTWPGGFQIVVTKALGRDQGDIGSSLCVCHWESCGFGNLGNSILFLWHQMRE